MTADKYDAIARELEEQWERDQVYSMKVRRDMIAAALRQAAADEREACEQAMKDIEIHSDDGSWYCDDSPSAAIRARGGK